MTVSEGELATTVRDVSEILRSLLALEGDVNTKAEFVELGLDSLGAMDFIAALEARFQVELSETVHVDHPTVADLASHIHRIAKK